MASAETGSHKIFSIILATYNCGQKVETTIQSILRQNRDLFELIVFDGASTDDTLDYIRKYESNLTLVSERDGGVYHAFNKGIELAAGDYLYFIGAGDSLREDVLEKVGGFLSAPDVPDFLYGDAYVVKEQYYYGGEFSESSIKTRNICHQAVFYHRRIFQLLGNFEAGYSIFADWALNLKCFGDSRIGRRHIQCVIVDFEGGGLSSTDGDTDFKRDFPRLIRNYLGVKSYVIYKLPTVYGKVYLPFLRPFVSIIRRLKKIRHKF